VRVDGEKGNTKFGQNASAFSRDFVLRWQVKNSAKPGDCCGANGVLESRLTGERKGSTCRSRQCRCPVCRGRCLRAEVDRGDCRWIGVVDFDLGREI